MHAFRSFTLAAATLLGSSHAAAVNWMMLQGTEPANVSHRPFLFMQPSLTLDETDDISIGPNAGKTVALGTIAPWFNNQKRLHFRRARIGIRGNLGRPGGDRFLDDINYFVLTELAPNLITYEPFGDRDHWVAPDHFSLTFNHIPGARIRAGLFKMPGPEESYQGVININYIEFTGFVATQMLERFATGNFRASPSGGTNGPTGDPVTKGYGFNAVRDWGIQLFDSHQVGNWDLSYALTLGRGEDIHTVTPGYEQVERYAYLSAEYDLPGGKGPFKNGIKTYAWHQTGERRFESDPERTTYDRTRYGLGVRAIGKLFGGKHKHRVALEAMFAEGMIFVGPAGGAEGGALQYAAEDENEARGITADYGFFLDRHWMFDVRWSRYDLLRETDGTVWTNGDRRELTEKTFGVTYHFSPKSRLTCNFIHRDLEAPNEDFAVVQDVVGTVGNRWAIQWTKFF